MHGNDDLLSGGIPNVKHYLLLAFLFDSYMVHYY